MLVRSSFTEVRRLAEHLRTICAQADIDDMVTLECETALVEAANNIVQHGYAGHHEGDSEIGLSVVIEPGIIRMALSDSGRPIPDGHFAACEPVPLDATSGRGTFIILTCVDKVDYESAGGTNRLVLTKHIS